MDNKYREAVRWIDYAEKDLASAIKLFTPPAPVFESAVYHCQQAAEKAAKSLLIIHDEPIVKTHDIGRIVAKLNNFGDDMKDLGVLGERLTDYALLYRYPSVGNDVETLTEDDVQRAIDDATTFVTRAKHIVAHNSEIHSFQKAIEVCQVCNCAACECPNDGGSGSGSGMHPAG